MNNRNSQTNRDSRSQRRAVGRFYTPEWLAQAMARRCIKACLPQASLNTWRMVDPACGDGEFVLAVLENLVQVDSDRLALVRDHVFGVDADPVAIAQLRDRVRNWIGRQLEGIEVVNDVVARNFQCGDALLGSDWDSTSDHEASATTSDGHAIQWAEAFPHVVTDGGFDLVIGNPPYRRELNAKVDFERIAASPLGQKWRRARMDLWHYFLHRGLDLLKPDGTLCYIVNSYWTGSKSATELSKRLSIETTMEEVIDLGNHRLFPGVSGHHMIFRARKGLNQSTRCQLIDLSHTPSSELKNQLYQPTQIRSVAQKHLWVGGRLRVDSVGLIEHASKRGPLLGDLFEVRQGIAENPPLVTSAIAEELSEPNLKGTGVFVLTEAEVESLRLNQHERSLLRPYYSLAAVDRFRIAQQPTHSLLYLTRTTAPDTKRIPHVLAHLERFRPILERRREVASGLMAWWHLHWPREERLFTSPRILSVQMGHFPRFASVSEPTYVGFSMHVILERAQSGQDSNGLSLDALTAILNSSPAKAWFQSHAKRRGANLDISGTVLKRFPLPNLAQTTLATQLEAITRSWSVQSKTALERMEDELNRLVTQCYQLE